MRVIKRPHITEKGMDMMDFENKMQFIVHTDATKPEVADEIEDEYEADVANVNTQITMNGEKKATVEFAEEDVAQDIASRMGAF
ncbi:MAG: large subunit ribosomal protein L23 [Methanobacteriota archaeon]|jgi:large subunit ribosomal protein L23|uniref:Large ribosomal subunit protein uL23 n=1 Tax=Halorutilus salinus TaxID=2487751 RepID=A0A9Q4C3R6_9EURY|nr:50S ribosomal protein L23 [Halorutilus salinus]MCX2818552.1 50S ribosomal protein L23 [Halorutilus salinus]